MGQIIICNLDFVLKTALHLSGIGICHGINNYGIKTVLYVMATTCSFIPEESINRISQCYIYSKRELTKTVETLVVVKQALFHLFSN